MALSLRHRSHCTSQHSPFPDASLCSSLRYRSCDTQDRYYPSCLQGCTVEMSCTAGDAHPGSGASLLGMPYAAVHGPGSLVVGSNKRTGLTPSEALALAGRPVTLPEARGAESELVPAMSAVWTPLGKSCWQLRQVRPRYGAPL